MKIGPLEGTHEEVRNIFEDNGLNLSDYLLKPSAPLNRVWLILPVVCIFTSAGILTFFDQAEDKTRIFIFLCGFGSSIWGGISLHIRFKSVWAAMALIIGGLLIMLVALGVLSPTELLNHINAVKDGA